MQTRGTLNQDSRSHQETVGLDPGLGCDNAELWSSALELKRSSFA